LCSSITTLTSLDFLGFGLPLGSPSLGELLLQGKNNLQAPWLGADAVEFLPLGDLFPDADRALTPEGFLHVFPQIYDCEGFFVAR
ncbi:hypothetical protein MJM04_32290, partial [Salmonella enterica subsp. enterica serovar Cerro]|nr:hypothetical protein [Salmonella enterica subsp. enterica serovar Cerro]